jgi:tRNA-2-methylthio-N6-dimethylallyladenosine synthase
MGRQYTTESYLRLVERLRAAIPGISLTTDIIVGFCGETEDQFENTLQLLRTVGYDQVFAAAFSPRPGTPAARLADDVPSVEKRRRLNALLAMQEGIGHERNRAWLGRETEVLVEAYREPRTHDHADGGVADGEEAAAAATRAGRRLSGRNRENRLIHVDGPADLVGERVRVRIDHAGPYAIAGTRLS